MNSDIIQVNYDQLAQLASRFAQQAEATTELHSRTRRAFEALSNDGWQGQGAAAFGSEMQSIVFPALQRLRVALDAAQGVTGEIAQRLRAAEQQAAQPFTGGAAGAGATGAAATDAADTQTAGGTNGQLGAQPGSMADLVQLLNEQPEHISIVDIGNNQYMVMLKGTNFGTLSDTNNAIAALQSGFELPSAYEAQVRAAIEAAVPAGGNIHFVSHSLGGIVAHNLVDNADFMQRYGVESVTTFGASQSAPMNGDVEYNRFRNNTDPVPMLDGGWLAQPTTGTQAGEWFGQTAVNSGNFGAAAHEMTNYQQAPELQTRALPNSLDLSNWQQARRVVAIAPEYQPGAFNDNTFFNVADRISDLGRTVPLVAANSAINSGSVFIPPSLRDDVEIWSDRANDYVLNDVPSPSQVAGGIVDGWNASYSWFMGS